MISFVDCWEVIARTRMYALQYFNYLDEASSACDRNAAWN